MLKWRVLCFEGYQLNKFRNFVASEYTFEEENTKRVMDICTTMLKRHGCPNSAVFLLAYDDSMFAVLNMPESDDEVEVLARNGFSANFFADVDAEYRLCCYALIIEVRPNIWKVIAR